MSNCEIPYWRQSASGMQLFDLMVPQFIQAPDDRRFNIIDHCLLPGSVGTCQDSNGGGSPDRLSPLFKGARRCDGISIRTAQMKISLATTRPFDVITADVFTSSAGFTRRVVSARSAERLWRTSKVAETKAALGLSPLRLPKNQNSCPKTCYKMGVIRQSPPQGRGTG
jgi:hypothetical protein